MTREVLLGKVEGELATCQQALKQKTEALAAHVGKAKEVEAELLTDGAEAYGAGFEDRWLRWLASTLRWTLLSSPRTTTWLTET